MSTKINRNWRTVVEQLRSRGVSVAIPLLWGGMTEASIDDIGLFLEDRELFDANRLGMTREEVRDYSDTEGMIRCSGTTAAGTRCKNVFPKVLYYEPELWLKLRRDGWLCHCHRKGGADG